MCTPVRNMTSSSCLAARPPSFVGVDWYTQKYDTHYDDFALANSGFSTQPADGDRRIGWGLGLDSIRRQPRQLGDLRRVAVSRSSSPSKPRRRSATTTTTRRTAPGCSVRPPTRSPVCREQLADADLGNTFSKTTGKIAARWTPVTGVLVRGSYGTGFRAPGDDAISRARCLSMAPPQNSYACPFPGSISLHPRKRAVRPARRPQRALRRRRPETGDV